MYYDHVGRNSSKIISQLVSLACLLSVDPNITNLHQGEHPKVLAKIWKGRCGALFIVSHFKGVMYSKFYALKGKEGKRFFIWRLNLYIYTDRIYRPICHLCRRFMHYKRRT